MSKAERTTAQMCEACCMHNDPECGYECRNLQRKCTNNDLIGRGYEQAEKDIALTWEDIKTIGQIIATSDWYDFEINGKLWSKEFYEEVLTRFKQFKEGNNDQD